MTVRANGDGRDPCFAPAMPEPDLPDGCGVGDDAE